MSAVSLIQGARVALRAPEPADFPVLHRLRNDIESQVLLMSRPRGSSMARVREWVSRMTTDEQTVFLIVATRKGSRAVGYIQLARIDPWHSHAELGICIDPGARGRGYGKEAISLLEIYGDRVLGLRKIHLKVLAHHETAVLLYRRAGFRKVGTYKRHFLHAGSWHDVLLMEKQIAESTPSTKRKAG